MSAQRAFAGFAGGIAIVAVLAVATLSQRTHTTALAAGFPQTNLDMIKVMESMAPKAAVQSATQQMATAQAAVKATKKQGLSMQQQYARIMQNEGKCSRKSSI
jgi:hypothetical protein